jgi:hypothetical protein
VHGVPIAHTLLVVSHDAGFIDAVVSGGAAAEGAAGAGDGGGSGGECVSRVDIGSPCLRRGVHGFAPIR